MPPKAAAGGSVKNRKESGGTGSPIQASKSVEEVVKGAKKKTKQGMSTEMIILIVCGVLFALFLLAVLFKSPVETEKPDSRSYLIQAVNYLTGNGATKNEEKGLELLIKSAKLGHPEAQHRLGYYYNVGTPFLEKDPEQAYHWFSQSAKQGFLDSMLNLGLALINGQGVEQNMAEGFKWWKKAANRGNPVALGNVGRCYEVGLGVERDLEEAVKYYKKGMLLNDAGSMYHLGNMHLKGINMVKDSSKAIELFNQAFSLNYVLAATALGEIYLLGTGVPADQNEAMRYLRIAAEKEEPKAQYYIGVMYETNEGADGNVIEVSQINMYGLPYDPNQAFQIYQAAAQGGSYDAMFRLSQILDTGKYFDADHQSALQWLLTAANGGHGPAAFEVYNKNGSNEYGGLLRLTKEEAERYLMYAVRDDSSIRKEALAILNELRENEAEDEGDEDEEDEEVEGELEEDAQ